MMGEFPTPALDELRAFADQMHKAIAWGILSARAIPDLYSNEVREVRHLDCKQAERLLLHLRAEERSRGELDKRVALRKIALDLDAVRVLLPELAARACIEVGRVAREVDREGAVR